jgi:hypothetical protein
MADAIRVKVHLRFSATDPVGQALQALPPIQRGRYVRTALEALRAATPAAGADPALVAAIQGLTAAVTHLAARMSGSEEA